MTDRPLSFVTVIHCDDAERASVVGDFLQNWAESGLVDADVWIVGGSTPTEWTVRAVAFANREHDAVKRKAEAMTLAAAMAARPYKLARLVHLTFVDAYTSAEGAGWDAITNAMRSSFRGLPVIHHHINLLVPQMQPDGTGLEQVPEALLQARADLNLIAAPEDRRSTGYGRVEFASPLAFMGWGATMAAAVAGIWTGVDEHPLDHVEHEDHKWALVNNRPRVAVARSLVRVLDGGFLVDHIGAGLIGRFDEWPFPSDLERPDDLIQARTGALDDIAAAFIHVDGGALRFKRVAPPSLTPKEKITWWRAFLMMFRFIADAIRRLPTAFVKGIYDRGRQTVADWAQKQVFGPESAYVVTFGGREARGSAGATGVPRTVEDVRKTAERVFSLLGDRNPPPPSPRTWRALRQLVLGLGDGGPLPDVGEPPIPPMTRQGANQLVIRSPDLLAPDPAGVSLVLPEELYARGAPLAGWSAGLRACDPLSCREILDALAAALNALPEPEGRAGGQTIVEQVIPPSSIDAPDDAEVAETPEAGESPEAEADSGEDEPDEAHEVETSVDDAAPASAIDELSRRRNLLEQGRAAVREYALRQRENLLWRVGENIGGELRDAIAEYLRAIRVVAGGRPDSDIDDVAKKARRRLFRRWLIVAVVAAALMLGAWLIIGVTPLVAGPVALLGLLIGWTWAFLDYHREMFQLQHRQVELHSTYEHAEESARQSSYEILKLIDRYSEYLDWAEILAGFVHRPWGRPKELAPSTVDMELAGVPRSFTVARGFLQERKVKFLRARALRNIIRTNWLTSQFDKVTDGVLEIFAEDRGLRRDREVPEPEEDFRRGPDSTRETLRLAIRTGEYSKDARTELSTQVKRYCRDLRPAEVFDFARVELRPDEEPTTVSVKGRAIQAGDTGIRLAPLTNPAAAQALDVHHIVQSVVPSVVHIIVNEADGSSTGSGVVLSRDGTIVTNAHVVGSAEEVVVQFSDGVVLDGRVVQTHPDEDLAVVNVAHPNLTPARRQRKERLQVGNAVIAVGNPAGLKGGPSVTLGIVSALDRQAAFDEGMLVGLVQTDAAISPGSSGGGLFDANGDLVGIPTAVRRDASNIGYAISVERMLSSIGVAASDDAQEEELASSTPATGAGADESKPLGMAYTDLDGFFEELMPGGTEQIGLDSCFVVGNELVGVAKSTIIWAPTVVAVRPDDRVEESTITPPVDLGRKLVYASCRLDLTEHVDATGIRFFGGTLSPSSPGDTKTSPPPAEDPAPPTGLLGS